MKKQQLYLSSIADDAPQTAKDYGLGLELAQFCTAAFLDNPDKVDRAFPAGLRPLSGIFPCRLPVFVRPVCAARTF